MKILEKLFGIYIIKSSDNPYLENFWISNSRLETLSTKGCQTTCPDTKIEIINAFIELLDYANPKLKTTTFIHGWDILNHWQTMKSWSVEDKETICDLAETFESKYKLMLSKITNKKTAVFLSKGAGLDWRKTKYIRDNFGVLAKNQIESSTILETLSDFEYLENVYKEIYDSPGKWRTEFRPLIDRLKNVEEFSIPSHVDANTANHFMSFIWHSATRYFHSGESSHSQPLEAKLLLEARKEFLRLGAPLRALSVEETIPGWEWGSEKELHRLEYIAGVNFKRYDSYEHFLEECKSQESKEFSNKEPNRSLDTELTEIRNNWKLSNRFTQEELDKRFLELTSSLPRNGVQKINEEYLQLKVLAIQTPNLAAPAEV